LTNTMRKKKFK